MLRNLIVVAVTVLTVGTLVSLPVAATERYAGVARVVAMSDPHGDFDAFARTLTNAGVLDEAGHWAAADAHLVVTGDLLDRGADSRRIMDLVMQLESEAEAAGGRVHLTLGNHEVMNLVGDLRYVSDGEYAVFADEETTEERDAWFARLLASSRSADGEVTDEAALRAEFDRQRPPGFYAHRRAFSSDGRYGRWLLQKPPVVVVNDTAYVHGGLPDFVHGYDLDGLNAALGRQVRDYVAALETLYAAGLVDPAVNFYKQPDAAEAARAATGGDVGLNAAIDTVVELNLAPVHASASPLWYRGTVGCSLPMESDVLAGALEALGVSRVVIGHTPTVTRQVMSRFGGRVIEIDTGMLTAAYGGSGHALVIEGGNVSVVDEAGGPATPPVAHPRRVGVRADELDADALADLLANGELSDVVEDENGVVTVTVRQGEHSVMARFVESPRRDGLIPALAAYRLDRMLNLDMVPVTVRRTVDGRRGTLHFMPRAVHDEAARAAAGQGGGAWCPLPRQWNSMYLFDALIHNEGRPPADMQYGAGDWQLMLAGNADTFAVRPTVPRYLEQAPMELTAAWREGLAGLSDKRLAAELGDVLDGRRLGALGKRRDLLLER